MNEQWTRIWWVLPGFEFGFEQREVAEPFLDREIA